MSSVAVDPATGSAYTPADALESVWAAGSRTTAAVGPCSHQFRYVFDFGDGWHHL